MELKFDPGARFEVRRTLGSGAMGVVYEAYDRERRELVALKTLLHVDGHRLLRFKREFRAIHDLAHPNLVALHEFFEGDGEPFYAMELVHGVDFLTHVRGDEPRLRAALAQLAMGVAALHAAGKVHRDLKPANVLVTAPGRVVVLDYGLVAGADDARRSDGAHVVGTVGYMAPEQALSGDVTPAADWYSVGVMLFEALTGALPHDGRTPFEIMMKKQQFMAAPPRQFVAAVPPDLDALCVALLQIDPAARLSARGILDRLGVAPPHQPDGSATTSRATHEAPFVGRRDELQRLHAGYARSRDATLVYLVEGVSGVGKSQLVERFLEELAEREPEALVLAGRCYEREVVSYKALDGIADALARYLRHLPPVQVAELMPLRTALLARLFPVLRRVEAIALAPEVADVPDPHDRRARMFGALRELFARLAKRRRLVWFIDDLHWTDADSLVLLQELLAHEDAPPVLLIATMRPIDDPPRKALHAKLADLAPVERLLVDELTPDEARELTGLLLPDRDAATLDLVAADAGGHPLFLHELARHAGAAAGAALGATFDQMLTARLDQLGASARRLLQVVAVFGGPLAQEVAALAAELSPAEHADATRVLRAANLARTDGVRRTDRIVAYHDRVREHVTASLDDASLRHVHTRLALALEQTGAAEHAPRALVRHARAAGRHALAAAYALTAAGHAVASLAFDQAAEFYAVAIELGTHDDATLGRLRIELATALANAGRGPEAAELFMAAGERAEPAVRLDCQRQAADQWIITGHIEQGMAALRASLADLGESLAISPRRALARVVWNRVRLRLRGLGFKPRRESQVSVELLRRLDVFKAAAHGLGMVDNLRGADFNGRFLLLALRTGVPGRLAQATASEVLYLASQGGAAGRRARRVYARLTRLVAASPDPLQGRIWAILADGGASYLEGHFAAAVAALAEGEALLREHTTGTTFLRNNTRVLRVHALRQLGALQENGALIAEAVRSGRQRGDRYLETTLQFLRGTALLAQDLVAEAHATLAGVTWTPPEGGYHMQHWSELRARVEIALYEGTVPLVFDALAPRFAPLHGSGLLRIQIIRAEALATRGRLLLAARGDRAHAEIERLARRLARERTTYATVYEQLLRAGRCGRRDDGALVGHLRRAIDAAAQSGMALHLAAARHYLGEVLGGDEGAALRAAAAAYVAREGVRRPERMYAVVAPGVREP